jgi:DNA polymerase-3 subunit gamma/tau
MDKTHFMSYQILARKYRPSSFNQVVGHKGILRALKNALDQNYLHHAYLLTGSRGVGKTSLARLLAKCLNCVIKVSSTPCGSCENCLSIQTNQSIDLIEIDAASRTRVEDIQGILENIQYKPITGRYKIYLIDEVHMLSRHSFNALLKTLEEPPPHIIFTLATTEPKRLPQTVLTRCLRLHLRNLSTQEIVQQLITILEKENIPYETAALEKIAHNALGSLRDALNLLEPVLLYEDTRQVTLSSVQALFGYISEAHLWALIDAIHTGNSDQLIQVIENISTQSIDFLQILDDLIELLYQIALTQQKTTYDQALSISDQMKHFSTKMQPEQVQLYYQIALMGKKDLLYTPNARIGFEMTLLRMLAFKPRAYQAPRKNVDVVTNSTTQAINQISDFKNPNTSIQHDSQTALLPEWPVLIQQLSLTGFLKSLAINCAVKSVSIDEINLLLDPQHKVLYSKEREKMLQERVNQHLGRTIKLRIYIQDMELTTPALLEKEQQECQQHTAYQAILKNQGVQSILKHFDATIQPESIYFKKQDNYEH